MTREIIAIVIGVIGSYIATVLYERRKRLAKSVAEREVFDLGSRDLVVVVPHRGREADSIIPRVAIEDVLAMKNIQEIVARIHPDMRIHIRDASRLTENDRKGNIITLGGTKANSFTAEVLNKFTPASFRFEAGSNEGRWVLRRDAETIYNSQSHRVSDEESPEVARQDKGLVIKLRNPLNKDCRIYVIAGIRGIGTWGAADCLRKHIRDVHVKKRSDSGFLKTGEFCMVVSVWYENFDITRTEITDYQDFN